MCKDICRIWTAALINGQESTNAGTNMHRFWESHNLPSIICLKENIPFWSRHISQVFSISLSLVSYFILVGSIVCSIRQTLKKVQGAQNAEVISWKIDLLYKKKLQSIASSLFELFLQNWQSLEEVCRVMTFSRFCPSCLVLTLPVNIMDKSMIRSMMGRIDKTQCGIMCLSNMKWRIDYSVYVMVK